MRVYISKAPWGVSCKLSATSTNFVKRALRIPRLLADTPRENAYINQLLEVEREVVEAVYRGDKDTRGLLRADVVHAVETKVQRALENAEWPDARDQNGDILLVKYEKGKPPRFVSVGLTDCEKETKITPANVPELKEILQPNIWENIRVLDPQIAVERKTIGVRRVTSGAMSDPILVYDLPKKMLPDEGLIEWFAFIPSLIYDWAKGELAGSHQQKTAAKSETEPWSFRKHLTLFKNLMNGLSALHALGYWHGDLRPANIMYTEDAKKPENYVIIDYGSFNYASPFVGDNSRPSDTQHTQ